MMRNFDQFVNERDYFRKDMPQVVTSDLEDALKILKDDGVGVRNEMYPVSRLKPSQRDINHDKVKAIMNALGDSVDDVKPFVIASDDHIVDGHHRWQAILNKFPDAKVPIIRIDLPMRDAIEKYNEVADRINENRTMKKFEQFVNESKSEYPIYHNEYSSALRAVTRFVRNKGYEPDADEWFNRVASEAKPQPGETRRFGISLTEDGEPTPRVINFQIFHIDGRNSRYELNMYLS